MAKRRDSLLDELRKLAEINSENHAVQEPLAKGLFNTINLAKDENDLKRRDSLLDELRKLAENNRDNATIRELLAEIESND